MAKFARYIELGGLKAGLDRTGRQPPPAPCLVGRSEASKCMYVGVAVETHLEMQCVDILVPLRITDKNNHEALAHIFWQLLDALYRHSRIMRNMHARGIPRSSPRAEKKSPE
jgi:hypothetical protein